MYSNVTVKIHLQQLSTAFLITCVVKKPMGHITI